MINKNFIKNNYTKIKKNNIKRNYKINLNILKKNINEQNLKINKLNKLRNIKNNITNKINKENKKSLNNIILINKSISINKNINNLKLYINYIDKNIKLLISLIPNILDISVTNENKDLYLYNSKINVKKEINLINKNILFCESLNISNNKTVILKNDIAILNRSLINFMLDTHINKGYIEYNLPLITNETSLYNAGQLPKFKNNLFYITKHNSNKIDFLIPTSEVQIINIFRNKKIYANNLPIKIVSFTPCFRDESGFSGKNKKGLIRLNQFDKVELIQIVNPSTSYLSLEEITNDAENIIKLLELSYKKKLLSIEETPFSSSKTYDLEIFFPSLNSYIEVSSCSNTMDFQSIKLNLKIKKNDGNNLIEYPHILNASGIAITRTLAAIIDTYKIDENKIKVPNVLLKYINKNYLITN